MDTLDHSEHFEPITVPRLIQHAGPVINKFPPLIRPLLFDKRVQEIVEKILCLDELNPLLGNNFGLKNVELTRKIIEDMKLKAISSTIDKIPPTGRLIVGADHPMGITDLVLLNAILRVREDINVLGMDFVKVLSEDFNKILISVNKISPRTEENRAEIRRKTGEALEREEVVVIMGAGTGARKKGLGLRGKPIEAPWQKGIIHYALDYDAPILPAAIDGENSWWYYPLRSVSKTLSMFLYLDQFFRKRGAKIPVTFGDIITPEKLREMIANAENENDPLYATAQSLREIVIGLKTNRT